MVFARLALDSDFDAVAAICQGGLEETAPNLVFDRAVFRRTFDKYLTKANPTFFVADDRRDVTGFLMAVIHSYAFTSGIFCSQEVLCVRPDKRGTRAAARLAKHFDQWSEGLGAKEVHFGIANGFQPDRTARFLELVTGAQRVGHSLKRITGK